MTTPAPLTTAATSQSVFGTQEPKNTKYIFDRVRRRVLERVTTQLGQVRFAQVGANDGRRADPINPFILEGRWKGLLVEPLPQAFSDLQKTYAGIDGLMFERVAITDHDGEAIFYAVSGVEDVLSSFSKATILRHAPTRPGLPDLITEMSVPTRRLDALLDDRGLDGLDVLLVDTEGHDDVVISTIDLERRRPALILFEHTHLSREGSQALRARIDALGYAMIWDRHDVLAIRPGLLPEDEVYFYREVVAAARL